MNVALLDEGPPPPTNLVSLADKRLATYLQGLQRGAPALAGIPQVLGQADAPEYVPTPGGSLPKNRMPEGEVTTSPRPWLRNNGGIISFSAKTVKLDPGEQENVLVADGAVVLDYRPANGDGNPATLGRAGRRLHGTRLRA